MGQSYVEATKRERAQPQNATRAQIDALFRRHYASLVRIAACAAHSPSSGTADVVHETYLQIVQRGLNAFATDEHFLAHFRMHLRWLLADRRRLHRRGKRGAGAPHASLDDAHVPATNSCEELVALREAFRCGLAQDPSLAVFLHAHLVTGQTIHEVAEELGVSRTSLVDRYRRMRERVADLR